MARGTKPSKGISLEELMQAQERMMGSGVLSEKQLQVAKEQLEKLDTIAKASTVNEDDANIQKITARKAVPGSVGLVDVKNEIKNLSNELKKQLPKFQQAANDKARTGVRSDETKLTDAQRNERLTKLAEVIGEKVKLQKGGSLNETLTGRNRSTFEQFIKETQKRDDLLADANEDQREIFKQIEDTLIQLQEAGSEDSAKLRKELDKLAGELKESGDTSAKKKIEGALNNARNTAATGTRGAQGNFGDALAALLGRQTVLKEGFVRDQRGTDSQVRDVKTGKFADVKDASLGRIKGAGAILGSMFMERYERSLENKRGGRVGAMFDAIKGSRSQSRADELEGQQKSLTENLMQGKEAATAGPRPAKAMAAGAAKSMAATTVNISGKIINLKGPVKIEGTQSSAAKANELFSDAGGSTAKEDPNKNVVKAIKELTDVVKEQGGMGNAAPSIPINPGSASGKTPKGGARPGNAAKAAKNIKPGSPVVMGLSLIAGYFGMSMIDDKAEESRAERNTKYDEMIASGDPDQAAKGQFMKEQEMSIFEKIVNIQKQTDDPERQERLKNAPWYTRYLGIGEDTAVAPSLRPPQGPEIAARTAAVQDQRANASAPVIINAPTTVNAPASKGDNTVTTVMRAPVRSEDNAFNNYMNRIYNPF